MKRPVDIDPRKIKLNYEDCSRYITLIQKEFKDERDLKINLIWLNQGPAADKEIPAGKIYLYQGYIKPAVNKEVK